MKPIGACIFVVYFLMIFASLVRFYVFVMPPGGSKMLAVDVSIGPYQWLGRSPSYHEVLTPVQLLLRLQNHHHHTQAAATSQTSLAMDQEEKKLVQVQSIRDQLKGHSLPDGGEIVWSINSSSSEFNATNNRAHIVRQFESGSTASDRKTTRETPDRKGITFSLFSLEYLRQYFVRKLIKAVSVCILLAIYIFCSKVSLHLRVRSSTQPSASQQVEIVKRILLSLSDDSHLRYVPAPLVRAPYYLPYEGYGAGARYGAPYDGYGAGAIYGGAGARYGAPYEGYGASAGYGAPPYPYEEITPYEGYGAPPYPYVPAPYPYEEIRIPPVPAPCRSEKIRIPPVPAPPPKAPEKPKLLPRRGQTKGNIAVDLQQYFGHKRKDVAELLGVSVSTFKRMCRQQGIPHWQNQMGISGSVSKPPYQHGEGNTSTARETPSHNVQTGMEGEPVGQNQEANECRRDFMGGPIALNTESGLIMVLRPPDQHGERNTSTACETPSRNVETGMEVEPVGQNPEANVFRRDFMGGPIALNTDGLTFPECSDAVAHSQPMATILDTIPHLTGCSSECAFQVKNQSTQFTSNQYPNGLVDPHPQIALTQILSENMERLEDRRNLLAPRKEPLPEGHVFGSVNWTVRSCSDVALSQPMTTIPHTTGCSEYWRNSLALLEEHLLEENDYGSINLTAPSCFDPGPSQPMHTIPHTMPTIPQTMPLLTERQDMRSVRLKATYGNTTIKFPVPSGFSELKEEVSKRLEFERGSFKLEYKDEEGDSVLIACDEDVRDYLRLLTSLGNQVVKLFVLDKVPNTTNFCDNCRSLKC